MLGSPPPAFAPNILEVEPRGHEFPQVDPRIRIAVGLDSYAVALGIDIKHHDYAGMVGETMEELTPEERHRIYKLLRLGVRFRPDWPLEITGIYAEVAETAANDMSYCKLSPGSFSSDELPALKFSALLTEDGIGRLELARA